MSGREFAEWQAYFKLEPFGDTRADLRAGIITSNIVNVLKSQKSKRTTPLDFMYFLKSKQYVDVRDQVKETMELFL